MKHSVRATGRGWAYAGAFLGGAVSIAANVAHSYVPPENAPADWTPPMGSVVGAVFWPIALFVAVEILARVAWPDGTRWWVLRFAGLLPVALVAAVVSYGHLSGLLTFYGEADWTAAIGPLAVDGLMVMATSALIATGNRRPATAPAAVEADAPATPTVPEVPAAPTALAETAAPTPDPVLADFTATDPTPAPAPRKQAAKAARPRSTYRAPSAEKVAKAAARMPGATVAQIAARAGVSESTARRHLPAGVASPNPARPASMPALADAA